MRTHCLAQLLKEGPVALIAYEDAHPLLLELLALPVDVHTEYAASLPEIPLPHLHGSAALHFPESQNCAERSKQEELVVRTLAILHSLANSLLEHDGAVAELDEFPAKRADVAKGLKEMIAGAQTAILLSCTSRPSARIM